MRTIGEMLAARLEAMGADGLYVEYPEEKGCMDLEFIGDNPDLPTDGVPAFRDADEVLQPLPENWSIEHNGSKLFFMRGKFAAATVWQDSSGCWDAVTADDLTNHETAPSAFAAAEARMK